MALFLRFFVVTFGFFCGCLAAGATIIVATAPAGTLTGPFDDFDWLFLWVTILTSAALVSVIAFVPAMIAILIAETFVLRSIFFYALASGIGGLIYGLTFPAGLADAFDRTVQITLAAGVAGGLVYWLVAGRSAGAWRGSSVQSAANI